MKWRRGQYRKKISISKSIEIIRNENNEMKMKIINNVENINNETKERNENINGIVKNGSESKSETSRGEEWRWQWRRSEIEAG
jgi:hypothetical protein